MKCRNITFLYETICICCYLHFVITLNMAQKLELNYSVLF